MSKAKILHINASPEFLANPKKMALLQKMADIAAEKFDKARGRRPGEHIWDDYDVNHLAGKCSRCGILRKMKKRWNKSATKVVANYAIYFINEKWVDKAPECLPAGLPAGVTKAGKAGKAGKNKK